MSGHVSACCDASVTRRRRWLRRWWLCTACGRRCPLRAVEAAAEGETEAGEMHGHSPRKVRPWWCQDPACTPASSDTGAQLGSFTEHPEYSGFCCGTLSEPITFDRHGQHHVNDGHLCFRSAIRGVVMLEVNEGDLDAVCRVAMRGILARNPGREFNGHWYTGRESGWACHD